MNSSVLTQMFFSTAAEEPHRVEPETIKQRQVLRFIGDALQPPARSEHQTLVLRCEDHFAVILNVGWIRR